MHYAKKLTLAVGMLASSSLLASSISISWPPKNNSKWPKPDNKVVWSCKAYDASGSGLFYIGLDENRWEAREKALDICYRFVDSCTVSCERKL